MDIIINADIHELPLGVTRLASQGDSLLNLMHCLDFPVEKPPLADFLRQSHHLDGQWLILEPIHWQATHNDALILASGAELALTEETARALFEEVATFLAKDDFQLHYHNAYRWLLKSDGRPALNSLPTAVVRQQSMMAVLKTLDPSLYWQRLLTELQMLLSTHQVNGLWCYGEGVFQWPKQLKSVLTDDEQLLQAFPNIMQRLSLESLTTSCVLIQSYQPSQLAVLEALTLKQKTRWFWNNQAYIRPAMSWWRRWV